MAHIFNLSFFNILDAMITYGVNYVNVFLGNTPAFRLATEIFGDDFTTCMDKTFEELDSNFKTYFDLTQGQGQIGLLPGIKRNIKAFIQWVRDDKCLGRNPETMAFPVVQAPALLRRYKTHAKFVSSASTLADNAKPEKRNLTCDGKSSKSNLPLLSWHMTNMRRGKFIRRRWNSLSSWIKSMRFFGIIQRLE